MRRPSSANGISAIRVGDWKYLVDDTSEKEDPKVEVELTAEEQKLPRKERKALIKERSKAMNKKPRPTAALYHLGEDIGEQNNRIAKHPEIVARLKKLVVSLMGAIVASHIDKDDPPVFIAHGTSDNVAPYAMVQNMLQQLEEVNAEYSFYPVDGVTHRLQTILDTAFDGKTVRDHSLDFCFEAMELGALINDSR